MLIVISSLFLLLIIAIIIAFGMNVLLIRLPSQRSQPYPFVTLNPLPNFTLQPFPPPIPGPLPVIPTLPTPTDQLHKRTFLCQMYLLNQANQAYSNYNLYEYRQASQMIRNAIHYELKQSSLKPYLENVQVLYLRNSGPNVAVEFAIILLVPSHAEIGVTAVKNVLLSILPQIEEQLNGTHIDRNNISVEYLSS
uniref:SEA domain-containing protein n=1 Tax=Setaria digitata TaxID=48799 RepID=A0A915PEV1_9BILA